MRVLLARRKAPNIVLVRRIIALLAAAELLEHVRCGRAAPHPAFPHWSAVVVRCSGVVQQMQE